MGKSTIKTKYAITRGTFDNSKLPSGVTNNGCSIYKQDNIVQFTIDLKASSQLRPATIPLTFIPEGYRPYAQVNGIVGDGSADGQSAVTIGSTIAIYFGPTKYAQGTFTYFVSNN